LALSRVCSSLGADIGSVLVVVESNASAAAAVPLERAASSSLPRTEIQPEVMRRAGDANCVTKTGRDV
jgi:hypothetical protein